MPRDYRDFFTASKNTRTVTRRRRRGSGGLQLLCRYGPLPGRIVALGTRGAFLASALWLSTPVLASALCRNRHTRAVSFDVWGWMVQMEGISAAQR